MRNKNYTGIAKRKSEFTDLTIDPKTNYGRQTIGYKEIEKKRSRDRAAAKKAERELYFKTYFG